MPFYYSNVRVTATSGTPATLVTHLRYQTVANQAFAKLMSLYGASRFATAGGAVLRAAVAGTIGTGGTANTPNKKHPDAPAAGTTVFDDTTAITAGATPAPRVTVGVAQTGGAGGWVAMDPDNAITLKANGGATGNAEIGSAATGASVPIEITAEFYE